MNSSHQTRVAVLGKVQYSNYEGSTLQSAVDAARKLIALPCDVEKKLNERSWSYMEYLGLIPTIVASGTF